MFSVLFLSFLYDYIISLGRSEIQSTGKLQYSTCVIQSERHSPAGAVIVPRTKMEDKRLVGLCNSGVTDARLSTAYKRTDGVMTGR